MYADTTWAFFHVVVFREGGDQVSAPSCKQLAPVTTTNPIVRFPQSPFGWFEGVVSKAIDPSPPLPNFPMQKIESSRQRETLPALFSYVFFHNPLIQSHRTDGRPVVCLNQKGVFDDSSLFPLLFFMFFPPRELFFLRFPQRILFT